MIDPVIQLERDLNRTHLELADFYAAMRRLSNTVAVSWEHRGQRARLMQRTREEITRLEGLRDGQARLLAEALRAEVAA